MITLTTANLLGIILVSGLLGGTFTHYGPAFLAWTDARRVPRVVTDDPQQEYAEAADEPYDQESDTPIYDNLALASLRRDLDKWGQ